jgi:protein-tyrosine phosphatase
MSNSLSAVRAQIRTSKSFRLITTAVLSCASWLSTQTLPAAAQDFKFTGVANFRDIGGYPAGNGHKIKSRLIFRSGELSGLTPADQQAVTALNIRYEIDLRTDAERSANPSNWGKKVPQVISISVGMPRDSAPQASIRQFSEVKDAAQAKMQMAGTTANLAINGAADIGKVLGELAKANGPALIHCTAGKDRTGVTVAVLMTVLGASREDVYHEYLRSNESVRAQLERQKARQESGRDVNGLSGLDPSVVQAMMGTDSIYLDAVFREIDAKYGSFDGYTRNGLKISAAQIAQLRKTFVD